MSWDKSMGKEFERIKAKDSLKCKTSLAVMERSKNHRPRAVQSRAKWLVSVACALLFVSVGVGGHGVYYTEAAAVSLDINPSVELSINCFGRIVKTKAFDEESQRLLNRVGLINLSYEKGLEKLLSGDAAGVYLDKGSVVSVTLETKDSQKDKWLDRLEHSINRTLISNHDGVTAEYGSTTNDVRREAHHQGMSMGKYCAIQLVLEEEEDMTMEELKTLNIDEIKTHKYSCSQHRSGHHK